MAMLNNQMVYPQLPIETPKATPAPVPAPDPKWPHSAPEAA
jgi:hypothetical protein